MPETASAQATLKADIFDAYYDMSFPNAADPTEETEPEEDAADAFDAGVPEDQDVAEPVGVTAQAMAQQEIVRAARYTTAVNQYAAAYPDAELNIAAVLPAAAAGKVPKKARIGVAHVAQETGYYCGPAVGYMILKYEKKAKSKYNDDTLTQKHLANSDHMNTDEHHVTTWSGNQFPRGINRFRSGATSGFYLGIPAPSAKTFRHIVVYGVTNKTSFAANAVELVNGPHYNHHPNRKIGHWLAGYKYEKSGNKVGMKDPSTSVFPDAKKQFNASTGYFARTYLLYDGVVF